MKLHSLAEQDSLTAELFDKLNKKNDDMPMQHRNGKCYVYTAQEIELYRKKLIARKLLNQKNSISNQLSSLVKEILPLEKKLKKKS